MLRQLTASVILAGKTLVICGFRAGGARAQLAALRMQAALKADFTRMLDTETSLPNKCWTHVFGIGFGAPKFVGKVCMAGQPPRFSLRNIQVTHLCLHMTMNLACKHWVKFAQEEIVTLIPECRSCLWNFVMEGDAMLGLMTCLSKGETDDKWRNMLSAIDKGLRETNIDDEALAEELQNGEFVRHSRHIVAA